MNSSAPQKIICILCGNPLLSLSTEEKSPGEYVLTLVCSLHSDQDLRDQGLDDLWGGRDVESSDAFFEERNVHVVKVWEQGPKGCHGIYLLLDNGDLVMAIAWGFPFIAVARVPRNKRVLDEPIGIPACAESPWTSIIKGKWKLTSLRLTYGSEQEAQIQLVFGEKGNVTFSSYPANWKELGDLHYFLGEKWSPLSVL